MSDENNPTKLTPEEAYSWVLSKAETEAKAQYDGDVYRAIRGQMLQSVPESQWQDFADYCATHGKPLEVPFMHEIQRLRKMLFDAGLQPETGQRL